MGKSAIEWLKRPGTVPYSWNVVRGCTRASRGCEHCYARRIHERFAESRGWGPFHEVTTLPHKLDELDRKTKPHTVLLQADRPGREEGSHAPARRRGVEPVSGVNSQKLTDIHTPFSCKGGLVFSTRVEDNGVVGSQVLKQQERPSRRRVVSEHTPGPWKWGSDWDTYHPSSPSPGSSGYSSEGSGGKYANLGLYGRNGERIIPLRVDHYAPEWDIELADEHLPSKADRDLIADAPRLARMAEAGAALKDAARGCRDGCGFSGMEFLAREHRLDKAIAAYEEASK